MNQPISFAFLLTCLGYNLLPNLELGLEQSSSGQIGDALARAIQILIISYPEVLWSFTAAFFKCFHIQGAFSVSAQVTESIAEDQDTFQHVLLLYAGPCPALLGSCELRMHFRAHPTGPWAAHFRKRQVSCEQTVFREACLLLPALSLRNGNAFFFTHLFDC